MSEAAPPPLPARQLRRPSLTRGARLGRLQGVSMLRRFLPAGSLAVLFLAVGAPAGQTATLTKITSVSPGKTARAFIAERGAAAAQNASLPRGRYCRANSGSFRLWWTEDGANTQATFDDGDCRTVPAKVGLVTDQLAASRQGAIRLGLKPVKGDGSRPVGLRGWPTGGDSRYDVALIGGDGSTGEAGLNVCRTGLRSSRSRSLSQGTYMRVFTGTEADPRTERELRATVTHEYFHGLQCRSLGLDRVVKRGRFLSLATPPEQLMEASAEWFSGAVYPAGQTGESITPQTFTFGRGTLLCSIPTSLLAGDVQGKYTMGTVLLGAFGDDKSAAKRIRSGLRKSRTTRFQTAPEVALKKAFGAEAIARGMTTAIQRSCAERLTVTGNLPVLPGTPAPQSATQELALVPGAPAGVAQVTVAPLATAIVVSVAGRPPAGRGPATGFTINVQAGGPAAAAAYTSGEAGAASTAFDAAGNASLPNSTGLAVVVIANPSLSQQLSAQVTVAAT